MRSYGFSVPDTFIVGSSEEANSLRATGGNFISKSCSGTKTRVVEMEEELWGRVGALDNSPSIIQRRISGADVRVHVVGDQLLSERIESSRVDYRFHDASVPPNRYSLCDVPDSIAASCLTYCEDQGLLFAGIDFKITNDDEWYVLEANPMPGYESYDRRQGHRISRALFELLTSHRETPPVRPGVTSGLGRGPSPLPTAGIGAESAEPESRPQGERQFDGPEQFIVEGRRPILTSLHCERRLRPEEYWVLDP
jgi:glutathione synthase/RimK-type ligase-like ATP-grasp enzyme